MGHKAVNDRAQEMVDIYKIWRRDSTGDTESLKILFVSALEGVLHNCADLITERRRAVVHQCGGDAHLANSGNSFTGYSVATMLAQLSEEILALGGDDAPARTLRERASLCLMSIDGMTRGDKARKGIEDHMRQLLEDCISLVISDSEIEEGTTERAHRIIQKMRAMAMADDELDEPGLRLENAAEKLSAEIGTAADAVWDIGKRMSDDLTTGKNLAGKAKQIADDLHALRRAMYSRVKGGQP